MHHVIFNFYPEYSISQAHAVALGGPEHGNICLPPNLAVFRNHWSVGFILMRKALGAQCIHDLLCPRIVDHASCQAISSRDIPPSVNVHELDRLDVARFESNSRARCYVQSLAISLPAVERELGVCLDEVVVGPNLCAWMLVEEE